MHEAVHDKLPRFVSCVKTGLRVRSEAAEIDAHVSRSTIHVKHMITFSAGVTLVESCAGRKVGDVIGQ